MQEKEVEMMKRAKMYSDRLANGVNPIDGSTLSENDIVNNTKVSRCLFYVPSILEQNLSEARKSKSELPKSALEFDITPEQLENFVFSMSPIGISKIISQLNSLTDSTTTKKLSVTTVTKWLKSRGYIAVIPYGSGKQTIETDLGRNIGITSEERTGQNGSTYRAVLYNLDAQKFIISNIPRIIAKNSISSHD